MKKNSEAHRFEVHKTVEDYLSPDNAQPLVLLPGELNPFHDDGVEIWAKVYGDLHVKFITMIGMLQAANAEGKLHGVHTLVEASSGNTAAALKVVAANFGIKKVVPVIPRDIAPGKLEVIRLLGMDPIFHSGDGIAIASKLGQQDGWYNMNQYANDSNPAAHEKWTGPQILDQTSGRVNVFAAALGTAGTMIGVSRFFRNRQLNENEGEQNVTTVGVICDPVSAVPGVRSRKGLEQISFNWEHWCDSVVEIDTASSYQMSLSLIKKGIQAGPSSGLALSGLYRFLEARKKAGTLDEFRDSDGKIVAVFICPDLPNNYWEKYSMALPPDAWKCAD